MKQKLLFLVSIVSICLWLLPGCSLLVSAPRYARIQIKGPGNHCNEVVIALDNAPKEDIRLNDRYAINLDFQWLWYEKEDIDLIQNEAFKNQDSILPLTPWFICKYRF